MPQRIPQWLWTKIAAHKYTNNTPPHHQEWSAWPKSDAASPSPTHNYFNSSTTMVTHALVRQVTPYHQKHQPARDKKYPARASHSRPAVLQRMRAHTGICSQLRQDHRSVTHHRHTQQSGTALPQNQRYRYRLQLSRSHLV